MELFFIFIFVMIIWAVLIAEGFILTILFFLPASVLVYLGKVFISNSWDVIDFTDTEIKSLILIMMIIATVVHISYKYNEV